MTSGQNVIVYSLELLIYFQKPYHILAEELEIMSQIVEQASNHSSKMNDMSWFFTVKKSPGFNCIAKIAVFTPNENPSLPVHFLAAVNYLKSIVTNKNNKQLLSQWLFPQVRFLQ